MNLTILDSKTADGRSWYLCKANAKEYLSELKIGFYDFAIQRQIVKNQYLDKLFSTIKNKDPISIITLTSSIPLNMTENMAMLDLENVDILDGLQRTFRLWAYLTLANTYENFPTKNSYRDFAKFIKDTYPIFFETNVITTNLIKSLIESGEINSIKDILADYECQATFKNDHLRQIKMTSLV
ncbi:MAG: hypothetical protein Q8M43_04745 [Sulfuricurvum sp.]|uniref:hypothetical protein n=1 Tax=Sulfuricurvum sp. TaxID=2025608 RepID=UPI002734AE9F|nr:hypothetical protein [Sulfuricurvum sp.]MDP3291322.1 hypothetical protein [Sulfuricurvum sp.]